MAPRARRDNEDANARLGGDQSKIIADRDRWPGYVAHGSGDHAALIGVSDDGEPQQQAALRKALETAPTPTAPASKLPVNGRNYANGEEVKFGFVRRGGQSRQGR